MRVSNHTPFEKWKGIGSSADDDDGSDSFRIQGLPETFNAPFTNSEVLARRVLMEVSKRGKKG